MWNPAATFYSSIIHQFQLYILLSLIHISCAMMFRLNKPKAAIRIVFFIPMKLILNCFGYKYRKVSPHITQIYTDYFTTCLLYTSPYMLISGSGNDLCATVPFLVELIIEIIVSAFISLRLRSVSWRIESVSYTHLDVYKRQAIGR